MPNMVCVSNKKDVILKGNGFEGDSLYFQITIKMCDKTKRKCQSEEEIERFINQTPFILANQ